MVPKCEVDHFADVPEPYYSALFQTAKKLSPAIQKATGCVRVGTMFLGFEVPHCHYHLIPMNTLEDVHWVSRPQADGDELQEMQQKILQAINE